MDGLGGPEANVEASMGDGRRGLCDGGVMLN